MTLKYVIEGWVVPAVSIVGILGNSLTVLVLNHRAVKLKKSLVDILCGLATFDNLFLIFVFFMFSLSHLSTWYYKEVFPWVAPYLLPATNTLMTCSVYSTVAVAINRYVEMSSSIYFPKKCEKGSFQNVFILVFSIVFNLSRWFELKTNVVTVETNVTAPNGTLIQIINATQARVNATDLRVNETYIRIYSFGINTMVMIVLPVIIMSFSSYKIYHKMRESSLSLLSSDRNQARLKRNQSITRMLIGIVIMFLVCHTGKVVVSIYEIIFIFLTGKVPTDYAFWAKDLIVINTLLVVLNSSCNFAFYCGDVVFRECLSAISQPGCSKGLKQNSYSLRQSDNNHLDLKHKPDPNSKSPAVTEVQKSVNYV